MASCCSGEEQDANLTSANGDPWVLLHRRLQSLSLSCHLFWTLEIMDSLRLLWSLALVLNWSYSLGLNAPSADLQLALLFLQVSIQTSSIADFQVSWYPSFVDFFIPLNTTTS